MPYWGPRALVFHAGSQPASHIRRRGDRPLVLTINIESMVRLVAEAATAEEAARLCDDAARAIQSAL